MSTINIRYLPKLDKNNLGYEMLEKFRRTYQIDAVNMSHELLNDVCSDILYTDDIYLYDGLFEQQKQAKEQ